MNQAKPEPNHTEALQIREVTLSVLKSYRPSQENLIPVLQAVQGRLGFIPTEAMKEIAVFLGITPGEVFGVASFYNQFRFTPPGRHQIKVCLGTACHVRGGNIVLEEWERKLKIKVGEVTADREFGLERVACVGCCALAPVALVDEQVHGKMTPTAVEGALLSLQLKQEKLEGSEGEL